jgi:hypothetical protein
MRPARQDAPDRFSRIPLSRDIAVSYDFSAALTSARCSPVGSHCLVS